MFQPVTFALVYVGTTLKDLSDVTHGWGEVSTTRWVRETPVILFKKMLYIVNPVKDQGFLHITNTYQLPG